ncbi:type 11 methyltransferase [Trypanosoma grayi]|uniref:type 11 methyltransferase n=1 Tax=Trypanosoma grayi TaxID=71804 RepID=UPI0004F4813D|nr:type 11 methyltransferase [Trypanosoma grayi]KEG13073.1 type 11 methyltransferase [Trypanosoma grayi]
MQWLSQLEGFKNLRSSVCDWITTSMTIVWYREALLQCPMNATVLDVGIGTATGLLANRDIIRSKKLMLTGVEHDEDYVQAAQNNINWYELNDQVNVVHSSILDYMGSQFDVIFFSGSFMIMPNKVKVLKYCCRMLRGFGTNGSLAVENEKKNGVILFTQTFEQPTLLGLYVSPLVKCFLKLLTTIDFGQVTYEHAFASVLKEAGMRVVSMWAIKESYFRKQVVVIAKPEN